MWSGARRAHFAIAFFAERRETRALRDRLLRRRRDLRRLRERGRAVHHAVADRVDLGKGLDDPARGVAQHRHHGADRRHVVLERHLPHDLLAARLGIGEARTRDADALDKALAEHLLAAHVEELELERRRAAVYDENFFYFLCHFLAYSLTVT